MNCAPAHSTGPDVNSERAFAHKVKLDAVKRQGARTDLTLPQVAANFRADDAIGKDAGVSGDTVRRYVRLTNLIPEMPDMVSENHGHPLPEPRQDDGEAAIFIVDSCSPVNVHLPIR